MKLEIRSHFWPKTPNVREIKILIDGTVAQSTFLNCDEILDIARQLRDLHDELMNIGNALHDEIIG